MHERALHAIHELRLLLQGGVQSAYEVTAGLLTRTAREARRSGCDGGYPLCGVCRLGRNAVMIPISGSQAHS